MRLPRQATPVQSGRQRRRTDSGRQGRIARRRSSRHLPEPCGPAEKELSGNRLSLQHLRELTES
jgi:hypothetical protein